MFDFLWLANARLLLLLNGFLAARPKLYEVGLILTDKFADLLVIATFALLWFWPRLKEREYLAVFPGTPQPLRQRIKTWPQRTRARWMNEVSREQSRAQFLVLALAGVLGYILARFIAFELDVPRPFATWLPVHAGVEGAFNDLRAFGSFPSDHAVLLAALPIALCFWDRSLALWWLGVGAILFVTRIAVGFHSPLDMIGGALIGVLITYPLFVLYRKRGRFQNAFNITARGFELSSAPYCYFLYAAAFAGALEFAMHFKHVLRALFTIRADLMMRFLGHV